MIIKTIKGEQQLHTKLRGIELTQSNLGTYIINDMDKFKELAQGTEYENCNVYSDVFDVTQKAIENTIYDELIKEYIYVLTELISSVIFMEVLIKKDKEILVSE